MPENKPIKKAWRQVDGVLLFDKPIELSSNTALQIVRRLYQAAKAGHTGTLDPLASGLLPVCFGEATKFSADLLEADKAYEATLSFGATMTTGDLEGEILEEFPVDFSKEDLEAALPKFLGKITQLPPMYSAIKHAGQPLYKLARKGVEIERPAREVTIFELRLIDFSVKACRLFVKCSKGTYIRTLAEDIAKAVGSGAHLVGLRRTHTGVLSVEDAASLETLRNLPEEALLPMLKPVDFLLQNLPAININENEATRFAHGNAIGPFNPVSFLGKHRVYCESKFFGIAEMDETGMLQPKRLLSNIAL